MCCVFSLQPPIRSQHRIDLTHLTSTYVLYTTSTRQHVNTSTRQNQHSAYNTSYRPVHHVLLLSPLRCTHPCVVLVLGRIDTPRYHLGTTDAFSCVERRKGTRAKDLHVSNILYRSRSLLILHIKTVVDACRCFRLTPSRFKDTYPPLHHASKSSDVKTTAPPSTPPPTSATKSHPIKLILEPLLLSFFLL
jgi:hypothetical protein